MISFYQIRNELDVTHPKLRKIISCNQFKSNMRIYTYESVPISTCLLPSNVISASSSASIVIFPTYVFLLPSKHQSGHGKFKRIIRNSFPVAAKTSDISDVLKLQALKVEVTSGRCTKYHPEVIFYTRIKTKTHALANPLFSCKSVSGFSKDKPSIPGFWHRRNKS